MKKYFLLIILLLIFGCNKEIPSDEKVACTEDAKECPDGSFVARVPPDCEFAPCPQTNDITGSISEVDSIDSELNDDELDSEINNLEEDLLNW
jgi:hypothetical protein